MPNLTWTLSLHQCEKMVISTGQDKLDYPSHLWWIKVANRFSFTGHIVLSFHR